MLNCLLFEKFDLHYALCHFDSILLHYAKLFIHQSIDCEQIFDVTFENPPIEKSCVRHWWQLWHAKLKKFMLLHYFSNFAFMCVHSQPTKIMFVHTKHKNGKQIP